MAAAELRLMETGHRTADQVLREGPLVQTGANRLTPPIRGYMARIARDLTKLTEAANGRPIKRGSRYVHVSPEEIARKLNTEAVKLAHANDAEHLNRAWQARKSAGNLTDKKDIPQEEIDAQKRMGGTSKGEIEKMRTTIIDLLLAENVLTDEQHKERRIDDLIEGLDKLYGDSAWLMRAYGINPPD